MFIVDKTRCFQRHRHRHRTHQCFRCIEQTSWANIVYVMSIHSSRKKAFQQQRERKLILSTIFSFCVHCAMCKVQCAFIANNYQSVQSWIFQKLTWGISVLITAVNGQVTYSMPCIWYAHTIGINGFNWLKWARTHNERSQSHTPTKRCTKKKLKERSRYLHSVICKTWSAPAIT